MCSWLGTRRTSGCCTIQCRAARWPIVSSLWKQCTAETPCTVSTRRCNDWRQLAPSPKYWPSAQSWQVAAGTLARRVVFPRSLAASPCIWRTNPSSRAEWPSTAWPSRSATGSGKETMPTSSDCPSRRRRKRSCCRWFRRQRADRRTPCIWWTNIYHNCVAASRTRHPTY